MTKAFVALLFFLSFFLQAKENPFFLHYNYKVTQNGTSYGRTLTLEKNTTHIKIEANDEKNGNEKILLSKETEKLLEAQYEEPGQKILTIFVDNIGKKVLLKKDRTKEFKLTQDTFTSESLHYVGSSPGKNLGLNETKIFYFITSKSFEERKMTFTYLGEQSVNLADREILVKQFEMKVDGFLESIFWPYTYFFWYEADTGLIVRYEGREPNKELKIIEII